MATSKVQKILARAMLREIPLGLLQATLREIEIGGSVSAKEGSACGGGCGSECGRLCGVLCRNPQAPVFDGFGHTQLTREQLLDAVRDLAGLKRELVEQVRATASNIRAGAAGGI